MQDQSFALQPLASPKIIHWDEKWPEVEGIIYPKINYAIGITPKKIVPKEHWDKRSIMIRPEFRLSFEDKIIYSSISECQFMIYILKPNLEVPAEMFYEIIEKGIHPWFSQEFSSRTGRKIEFYYNLQENKDEIETTGLRALKEAGW